MDWWFEPLWKISVSRDDDIPNIWENKIDVPNHQPENSPQNQGLSTKNQEPGSWLGGMTALRQPMGASELGCWKDINWIKSNGINGGKKKANIHHENLRMVFIQMFIYHL